MLAHLNAALAVTLSPAHVATLTVRTDEETEHALDVLTHDGTSRSAAIRQAVLEAARRRERAAEMRQAVLHMDLGQPYDRRLLAAAQAAGLPIDSPA